MKRESKTIAETIYEVHTLVWPMHDVVGGTVNRFFVLNDVPKESFPTDVETFFVFDSTRHRVGALASRKAWTIELHVDLRPERQTGYVPNTTDEVVALLSHVIDAELKPQHGFDQLLCFSTDSRLDAAFTMLGFTWQGDHWRYDLDAERRRDERNRRRFAA